MRLVKRVFGRLGGDEHGGVAIYVALVSVIMLGFGALVVDLGRLYTLQTELQNAADAAALAGAAELDGSPTAITRARLAAKTALITNRQTFATGGANVAITDNDIRFLSVLPASDDNPVTNSELTTDPAVARFIEVTASLRQVDYLLAPVLVTRVGGDGNAPQSGSASAVAVAGYNSVVCNFPPLMICNPAEANGNSGAAFVAVPGEVIQLKAKGGSSQWAPGNFGLLDPPTGNTGAGSVSENLASANPEGCYGNSVSLRTGSVTGSVTTALNVRFDMYENPGFKNEENNSAYRPAPNVTKGKYRTNKWHEYSGATPPGLALPTHACFDTDTCQGLSTTNHPRFAPPLTDAEWAEYWSINHPGLDYNTMAYVGQDLNGDSVSDPIDADGDGVVLRKEMYDWEVREDQIPLHDIDGDGNIDSTDAGLPSTSTAENGNPYNYTGSVAPDSDRRILPVAVINCVAEGPINGNSGGPYPVAAFAKIFLVQSVDDPSSHGVYGEMIGALQPGVDDDILHDIVQLYR
jgi:Flp pilus assembly protein TadG